MLWARLAQASIARYRELESATGVTFYNEVGFLLLTSGLGQPASYGARTVAAIEEINLPARTTDNPANNRYYEVLSEVDMAQRFPRLVVQPGAVGIYQQ